jgi:cytochrome c oxidase subunit II
MKASAVALFMACIVLGTIVANSFGDPAIAQESEQVIRITAQKFFYDPNNITVKKDVPVVLELTSLDAFHGFNCPDLKIRADLFPNKTVTLRFTPTVAGVFPFHCDVFCGSGHEGMTGTIVVRE